MVQLSMDEKIPQRIRSDMLDMVINGYSPVMICNENYSIIYVVPTLPFDGSGVETYPLYTKRYETDKNGRIVGEDSFMAEIEFIEYPIFDGSVIVSDEIVRNIDGIRASKHGKALKSNHGKPLKSDEKNILSV